MMHCSLHCYSNSGHISKLLTGYALLRRAGAVTLSQQCLIGNAFDVSKPQHLRDARLAHLLIVVNGSVKLFYDNHDSYEIDGDMAEGVDFYFKRSYSRPRIPDSIASKVFPLGLNYPLYPDSIDALECERLQAFAEGFSSPYSPFNQSIPSLFRPTPANMHSAPVEDLNPKVLFMTRVCDPFDHKERSDEKARARIRMNETRASCVEALRREFRDNFLGGFERTDYAVKNYGEFVWEDDEISLKENYIKLLGAYPICVSTEGHHRSVCWKLGEYVAFSKAIVSERLYYQIPGDFEEGRNYLGFDNTDECVDAVRKLFTDKGLRDQIMKNNYAYYNEYVEPKNMIQRTLTIGMSGRRAACS
jgi:hypothetical protein